MIKSGKSPKSSRKKIDRRKGLSKGRLCAARGCHVRFKPYRPQQVYCSNACRQRAFYDQYQEENGESPQWARIKAHKEEDE